MSARTRPAARALGILTDRRTGQPGEPESVYDTFEASIPADRGAIGKGQSQGGRHSDRGGPADHRHRERQRLLEHGRAPRPAGLRTDGGRRSMERLPADLISAWSYSSSTQISVHVTVDFEMAE